MKLRLLIAGRTRYRLPLDRSLRSKFEALERVFDLRVIGTASPGSPVRDGPFRLVGPLRPRLLDGALFYLTLPFRIAGELRRFGPDAVVVQSPYEAAAALLARRLSRSCTPVVLDVHGDWRTASRLYGSPARRLLSPLADRVAAAAVRRADAVRTVSEYTTRLVRDLGVEPAAVFPAFMDLEPFLGPPAPLPERAVALFVGVLEHYKGVDELATAWRLAAPRAPGAELRIVGRGARRSIVEELVRELPDRTSWDEALSSEGVRSALDGAIALVLPSRSEGMGRVIVEAFCRGRPVVASRVGGIVDLVEDGVNGLLVPPQDPRALADALVRILSDRALAERLASGARPSVEPWIVTPSSYAGRTQAVVERARA